MHYQKPTEKRQTCFLKSTLASRQWLVYSCHAVITIFSSVFIVAVGQDQGLSLPKRDGEIAPIKIAQTDKRAEAERLSNQGRQLFQQGTAESLQQAIEKLETALPLWRGLGDELKEARINLILGKSHDLLGLKQKALDYYNQALLLYQQLEDRAGEGLTLYNIGKVYHDLGEKQRALEYYQQALPLAQTVGHRALEVRTLAAIGAVYSALGDKQRALEYYQRALPLAQTGEDRAGEATILINIGAVYSALGEKQRALEYYQQALPLKRAIGDRAGEALTLSNIGAVYDDLEEKQKALEYYQQALRLKQAIGDHAGEATTLNNIGVVYLTVGEKQKALEYWQQALSLAQTVGNRSLEATILNNINAVNNEVRIETAPTTIPQTDKRDEAERLSNEGLQLFEQGTAESLQQAIEKWETALPLWRELGDESKEAWISLLLGRNYGLLGLQQKALDYYDQSLVLYQKLENSANEATTLNNIGRVYDDLGDKQKALDYYQQALPLFQAVDNLALKAILLNNIGLVYNDLGEKRKALDYFQQALPLARTGGDRVGEVTTLNHIGLVYNDLGEKRKALDYFQQALPLARTVNDRVGEAITLNSMGLVYNALGEKKQALDYYQQALSLSRAVGKRNLEVTILNNINAVNNEVRIETAPTTIPQTDKRDEAERLSNQGWQLFEQGTAESRQAAIKKWEIALSMWIDLGEQSKEAWIYMALGSVYDVLGLKQKALFYHNQALPLYRELENRTGEAATLSNIGSVYHDLGEKQKALEYYQNALSLARNLGNQTGEATTLNNIGSVYSDLGEKQQALEYYQQALPLRRAVEDRAGEAVTLSNIGGVYSDLGEKQQALEYLQQALSLSQVVADRSGEAITLNSIGSVYSALGEKQKALEYHQQALSLSQVVGDRAGEAVTLHNIGSVYFDLGEKQQALEYYQQALPLRRAVGDQSGEAATLNSIGHVYSALGEKQQALEYYQQSFSLFQAVEDRAGEALTLNNIARVYDVLGEEQQALEYLQQSLSLHQTVEDRTGEAVTLNNIGLVYSDLGDNQQALEYFQQALPLSQAVGDRAGEAVTLSNIAVTERSRGNLQQALTPMQASIEIIEDLRTKVASPELRQTYFATVQNEYQFYIDLLMQLHQQNPSQGYDKQAFHASERSRARTLLELLTEANANIREGVDPDLLQQEQTLNAKLDATEKQRIEIYSNPESTPAQKTAIEQQRQQLLADYQKLQDQIRATSPKYAALQYPQPLTLEQVQQQILDEDTILLQYSLGRDNSYLWAVTKDSLTSYQLPPRDEIETLARRFYNLLQIPGYEIGNPRGIAKVVPRDNLNSVVQLSELLFGQVAEQLTKKRIVVVADGALQYIPFAALATPETADTDTPIPLINQYELVNLPSSSTLGIIRDQINGRQEAPKQLAILADPVFTNNDNRLKTASNRGTEPDLNQLLLNRSVRVSEINLSRLPGTRTEAEAILNLVSPETQTNAFDFEANRDFINNPQLQNYQIIHLATHGILNSEAPELSGVVLSLVDKQGNSQNGFLRLHDIFNLNLPAELVVLSACQTGLGEEIRGEGLVGLTRGFMYAGAPRLVVSLWNVDDAATAEFMTRFYQLMLNDGLKPAQALRETQLQMQRDTQWKSPYYWAAFTLQGEWN